MTAIKICGLTTQQDILSVNEALPDYIGFVFAPSKRQISLQKAVQLKQMLSPSIKAVGVFVNETQQNITSIVQKDIIDIVQLHGQETEQYIQTLKKSITVPIIKAISVKTKQDILQWQTTCADYLLLDNGIGGSGKTFDWSIIETIQIQKPYFIAGGLNIQNIITALQKCPFALDVSSGVETNGQKDKQKILEITKCVKNF